MQITSDTGQTGLVSVLIARTQNPEACARALLKTLVNEFHLCYLVATVRNNRVHRLRSFARTAIPLEGTCGIELDAA